jgi:hypothetical protein
MNEKLKSFIELKQGELNSLYEEQTKELERDAALK